MKSKKKTKLPKAVEEAKRSAAGTAKATAGRSRTFKDKTKYNRKTEKGCDEQPSEPKAKLSP